MKLKLKLKLMLRMRLKLKAAKSKILNAKTNSKYIAAGAPAEAEKELGGTLSAPIQQGGTPRWGHP